MEKKFERTSKYFFVAILALFFIFFFYISRYAPVAGDDWGYAVGGREVNPFIKAWGNYFSWSGRFLSELWGFLVTPHKRIWNGINACLFTGILYMITKLCRNLKTPILTLLGSLFLMLSVVDGLRMQTYTWMMGSTYVIPLLLFFVYVYFLKNWIFDSKGEFFTFICMGILNILIPLFMENAAAMLFGGNVLVLLYVYFKDKSKLKKMIIFTCISLIGVCIIRLSPGASFRLQRDHAEFQALSLFEKISYNWLPFIRYTFSEHVWLIRCLSLVMILLSIQKMVQKKVKPFWGILIILLMVYAFIQSCAWFLYDIVPLNLLYIMADLQVPHSLMLNSLGYTLFVVGLFLGAWFLLEDIRDRWLMVFFIFCAGGANLVMLISPIFDVRSSIYTVYLFIVIVMLLLNEFEISSLFKKGILALCIIGVAIYTYQYAKLYHLVHQIDIKRQSQIEYYRLRPDTKEAYILGYPPLSVHSADVLEGDDFHDEVFKEYYYLNPDMELKFYYLDQYTSEEILGS